MKLGFYPRLASDGIRKNRRLYIPYLLTCVSMVMMYYIIHYLAAMPVLRYMAGGRTAAQILELGSWVVALFAFLFLVYTNAFLMRRRKMEFGLYHILGMGKGNIGRMLLWETALLVLLSMTVGLLAGIVLSKLAELCLTRILHGTVTFAFTVNPQALWDTVLIFVLIFGLIFLKNTISLWRLSAVSLLRSENVGEKPPKANFLLGIGGLLILGAAYDIAVSIQSPLEALTWFFVAVLMVIVATYLLFIAGSVTLCRLLQKNKKYYYKPNHFVSVSSMAYRMKRNGAGLASICILSTMVLVMMLGSASLYFGIEDSLRARYPKDISVDIYYQSDQEATTYSEEKAEALLDKLRTILEDFDARPEAEQRYVRTTVTGLLRNGTLTVNPDKVEQFSLGTYVDVCNLVFVPLADYNRCMDANETLEADQVLLSCFRRTYDDPVIALHNGTVWRVKKQVTDVIRSGDAAMDIIPSVYVVVPVLETVFDALAGEFEENAGYYLRQKLSYSFYTSLPDEKQIELCDAIRSCLRDMDISGEGGFYASTTEGRAENRTDSYGIYGGLFFLGILLSIVFLLATVLMIYYKQISEGYEDQARFTIMRKVGMTRENIHRSVNFQMLAVFCLPLVTAGIHLCFAFPMVRQLLLLFNLTNTPLMIATAAISFLLFSLFYALIYRITSNVYCRIVSGARDEE